MTYNWVISFCLGKCIHSCGCRGLINLAFCVDQKFDGLNKIVDLNPIRRPKRKSIAPCCVLNSQHGTKSFTNIRVCKLWLTQWACRSTSKNGSESIRVFLKRGGYGPLNYSSYACRRQRSSSPWHFILLTPSKLFSMNLKTGFALIIRTAKQLIWSYINRYVNDTYF